MARTKQTARRPCLSKPALEALDKVRKAASDEQYTRARTNAIDSKRKASRRRPRGRQSSLSSSSDTAVEEYPAVAYSSSDPDTETGKKLIAQLRTIAASPQPESPNTIDNYLLSHELTASAYWSRYYQHGKLEDLENAVRLDRERIGLSAQHPFSDGGSSHAHVQVNLGVALLDLYSHTRQEESLVEAVSLMEQAASSLSSSYSEGNSPDKEQKAVLSRALANLGYAYRERAQRNNDKKDFDRAIDMQEEALILVPEDHPEWDIEVLQNSLARSLMARGAPHDVERALDLMSARRRVLAGSDLEPPVSQRDVWCYSYDPEVGLPVPDLSNLVRRLTGYPSGCGGYADIFMGEWNRTRRSKQKVAIKVLRSHTVDVNDTSVNDRINKMLRAEIRIWHKLEHPNIVKLLGTCRGFGHYTSMILPWFANGSLPSFLGKHNSLIYTERLRLIRDIASGLSYLHSNAIIHGDLTSANVLINDDQTACLSDFGLSTLAQDFELPSVSRYTSAAGGSVRWTAPELYSFEDGSSPRLSLQSDVYSFGSVALEVFSGNIPYHDIQNEMQVLLKYVIPGIPPARPMGSKIIEDRHWDAILRCWSKDPLSRPASKVLGGMFEAL